MSESGLPEAELTSMVLGTVRTHLAEIIRSITGEEPGAVDDDRPFREQGLDSLGGIELHRRLMLATGLSVAVTGVFEHPSPATLTRHLVALLRGTDQPAEVVIPQEVSGAEPLAIVGMSCRYPGGIGSPKELWQVSRTSGTSSGRSPATGAGIWNRSTTRPRTAAAEFRVPRCRRDGRDHGALTSPLPASDHRASRANETIRAGIP